MTQKKTFQKKVAPLAAKNVFECVIELIFAPKATF
jgi:hypothetical protein